MKFFFEGDFTPTTEAGKLSKVSIFPSTQSRACREIFVLVAKELGEVANGDTISFGLVGAKKTPMAFPMQKQAKADNRILLMGNIPQPKHRHDGFLDEARSTGKLLDQSCGGGAWGAGACFLAILELGQHMVSNYLIVWHNQDGELVKTTYDSLAEYELVYNTDLDVEMM